MRRGPVASTALLAALLLAATPGCASRALESRVRSPGGELLPAEVEVMRLVNDYRAGHGLPAHGVSPALCRAADKHALNMARHRRMSHVLDGRGPAERARAEGFAGLVAENCAAGGADAPRVYFELWVASPGHRRNMLSPEAGEMCAGVARTRKGDELYLAVLFGAPR